MDLFSPAAYLAMILLMLEAFVLLLIPLAITVGLWYGVRWFRRKLPPLFAQARHYLALAHTNVERGAAAAVAPLVAAHALAAQVSAWLNALASLIRGEN